MACRFLKVAKRENCRLNSNPLSFSRQLKCVVLVAITLFTSLSGAQEGEGILESGNATSTETDIVKIDEQAPLSDKVENLKKAALELNRDLMILEEDLLFPASTQVAVYVSVDVGKYFQLDAVKLKIDDELVASHLYTEKQNSALVRGGVQRLYLGNLKTGEHEITAFFHGIGPENREYKRGATYTLTKDQKPTMLEIRIMDATRNMQPEFDFKEWHL